MGVHTPVGDAQVVIDGQFVSQRISQVVEAIKEYSPDLRVDWVPPEARGPLTAAFKIVHEAPNGDYILFHVKTEDEFDERVLQRIIVNDQRNGQTKVSEYEAWEAASKRVAHQAYLDKLEEAHDIAKHALESRKHTYKVNDELTIKDGIPFNANRLKD